MADLSTISATDPADGEAVSQGASRIRTLVEATKTSFDVEHTLTGAHSFLNGAPASRPAAATAGRVFFDTTNKRLELDSGSAWSILHAVGPTVTYSATPVVVASGGFSTLRTATVDVPTGASVVCLGQWAGSAATTQNMQWRIRVDATTVLDPGTITFFASASDFRMAGAFSTAITAGASRSLTLEVNPASATFTTSFQWLLVLVC